MPIKVTNRRTGKEYFFPDYMSEEEIRQRMVSASDEELVTTDLLSAAQRGFAKHIPDIVDLGAGAVGLANDAIDLVTGEVKETPIEDDIREFGDKLRGKLAGESMMEHSDTFAEKTVEAAAGLPGVLLSFLPTTVGTGGLGTVGKAAVSMGIHGGLMSSGEGLTQTAMGAARGAAEGAAFGQMTKFAGGIPSIFARRVAHGAGSAGLVTGIGTLAGADFEDAAAQGLALGAMGFMNPGKSNQEKAYMRARKEVQERALKLMDKDKDLTSESAMLKAAEMMKLEQKEARTSEIEADPTKALKLKPEDPSLLTEDPSFTQVKGKVPPLSDRMVDQELQASTHRVRTKQYKEAFDAISDESFDRIKHTFHPVEIDKVLHEINNMSPAQKRAIAEAHGKEYLTANELVKAHIILKQYAHEQAHWYRTIREEYNAADMANNRPKAKELDAKMREAENDFVDTMATYVGLGKEWSKVGQARKVVYGDAPVGEKALQKVLSGKDVNPVPREIIQKIMQNPEDYRAAHQAIRAASNPSTQAYVYEAWINGLLSGPPTHFVNAASNLAVQIADTLVERPARIGFDTARHLAGGKKVARERYAAEMVGDMVGWWQGAKIGVKDFIEAMRDETYKQEISSKLDNPYYIIGTGRESSTAARVGGKITRMPSRILRASDLLFKAIGAQREGWATAYRLGRKKGLSGDKLGEFAVETMKNPDKVMLEQMHKGGTMVPKKLSDTMREYGELMTFTNKPNDITKWVMQSREKWSPVKWVIPFVRTPANIIRYASKRTPLGLNNAMKKYSQYRRGEIDAGVLADEAAGTLVGTVLTGMILAAAEGDIITGGGPTDWVEQQNKRQTGWQPYSIKMPNGEYYSYSRIEPMSTILGMAADARELREVESDEWANKMIAAVKENLTNKTFLTGIEALFSAVNNPDMFAAAYMKTMMGSMVPNVVNQVTNVIDPYSRETQAMELLHGIPEAAAKRMPLLSEQLPQRYAATGAPIEKPDRFLSGVIGDIARGISPIAKSKPKGAEAALEYEFDELSDFEGVPPSMPKRTIRLDWGFGRRENVKLTDEEYQVYVAFRQQATNVARQLVASQGWRDRPDWMRAQILSSLYRKYNSAARQRVNYSVRQRKFAEM